MNVGDLKKLLANVPDDFEVKIKDINFKQALPDTVDKSEIVVCSAKREVWLPAVAQDYLD